MGLLEIISLALTHPNEFRILLQFRNYYEPNRDIAKREQHPTSGWDRQTMRRCWELLDLSSRSFAAVIKMELDGDLARIVSFLLPRPSTSPYPLLWRIQRDAKRDNHTPS
jgi:farnesyl-diphosphate farnesyltransferase